MSNERITKLVEDFKTAEYGDERDEETAFGKLTLYASDGGGYDCTGAALFRVNTVTGTYELAFCDYVDHEWVDRAVVQFVPKETT